MIGKCDFAENADVIKFVEENGIKILNLCHVPEEGRLKRLSFSALNSSRVENVLEFGERADGSSLFSAIPPGESDVYVMPDISRAFVDPFAVLPTLDLMCDYLDQNGRPLNEAPRNILLRAERKLRDAESLEMRAFAELEFYIIAKGRADADLFPGKTDGNYQESSPFSSFEDARSEIMILLDVLGLPTKYGHAEVGRSVSDGTLMEQHEIEFTPQNLVFMAEATSIARWVIRNVCARHGLSASFIPKIDLNAAGTGMHVHLCGLRDGKNVVNERDDGLSVEALEMIGGILRLAPSLSAFANPTPVSYLRLISRKESPMNICWGAKNRLALIRIPLWWNYIRKSVDDVECRQTFEYRAPDAFANAFMLFAGLTVAVDYGFRNSSEALEIARECHVEASLEGQKFPVLPHSCAESAMKLENDRRFYESDDVFPKKVLDKTIEKLASYEDRDLWRDVSKRQGASNVLREYMNYG